MKRRTCARQGNLGSRGRGTQRWLSRSATRSLPSHELHCQHSGSIGTGGRRQLKRLVVFNRNRWSPSPGARTFGSGFLQPIFNSARMQAIERPWKSAPLRDPKFADAPGSGATISALRTSTSSCIMAPPCTARSLSARLYCSATDTILIGAGTLRCFSFCSLGVQTVCNGSNYVLISGWPFRHGRFIRSVMTITTRFLFSKGMKLDFVSGTSRESVLRDRSEGQARSEWWTG